MRAISYSKTEPQFLDGSKDITRRLGWRHLKPGTRLRAVRKSMGLRKGERQHLLGIIEVVSVRREPLSDIDQDDVRREGFPDWTPEQFVAFFCDSMGCFPNTTVTRIEFKRIRVSARHRFQA